MKIRYFDHAATTKVNEEVIKEMIPYFGIEYGNASSLYSIGRKSKRAIDEARNKVAKAINANSKDIYFTACGSESDNLAIKGIAYANKEKGNHIITSKIEHHAVLNSCKTLEKQGFRVTYLNVDENGIINLEELKNSITDETILITIMYANNEIGTIEPIEEIGKIAKENNIIFHTDSVQAIGNIKVDVKEYNIDAISLSGHKFYGPKGIGVAYVRENIPFMRMQDGGHQEKDKRAGTENVAGIVGIAKAMEIADENLEGYNRKIKNLRDFYVSEMVKRVPYIRINGDMENRLSGNANICFSGVDGAKLLSELDKKGICASSGSACSAGLLTPSHVLLAIGVPNNLARSSLRITFGKENTMEDTQYLVENIEEIVNNLRK